jgi:sugar lactone lactonase YvrE
MSRIEHVLGCQSQCGESPIWDPKAGRLAWIDTENPVFSTLDPAGGNARNVKADWLIQAIGRRKAGGWVAVVRDGFALWDPESAKSTLLGNPVEGKKHMTMNDGAVGPDGRFYAGSFTVQELGSDAGCLWRLDADRKCSCIQDGIVLPNGIAFSPDGRTMYVTEMWARRISAFDFDAKKGSVSRRRVLITLPEEEGYPDGLIVDEQGFLWSGHWQGFRMTRYDPDGKKERIVEVPVPTATCMAFGGKDLDQLFVTTGKKGLTEEQLAKYPQAGDLFKVKPGVRGMIEPEYLG